MLKAKHHTRESLLKLDSNSIAGILDSNLNSANTNPNGISEYSINCKPQFEYGSKIGYVKGTRENPITLDTMEHVKNTVVKNRPNPDRMIATPRPVIDEKKIIGFGISVCDGYAKTMLKYASDGGSILNNRGPIEKRAHAKIDSFVESEQLSPNKI